MIAPVQPVSNHLSDSAGIPHPHEMEKQRSVFRSGTGWG
jgi:hypothetical protein